MEQPRSGTIEEIAKGHQRQQQKFKCLTAAPVVSQQQLSPIFTLELPVRKKSFQLSSISNSPMLMKRSINFNQTASHLLKAVAGGSNTV
jgi:hypothetical protein